MKHSSNIRFCSRNPGKDQSVSSMILSVGGKSPSPSLLQSCMEPIIAPVAIIITINKPHPNINPQGDSPLATKEASLRRIWLPWRATRPMHHKEARSQPHVHRDGCYPPRYKSRYHIEAMDSTLQTNTLPCSEGSAKLENVTKNRRK